jgi:hypothetical protein
MDDNTYLLTYFLHTHKEGTSWHQKLLIFPLCGKYRACHITPPQQSTTPIAISLGNSAMSRPLRNYLLAVFFASSLTSTALSWSFGSSGGAGHRLRCRIASSTGVPVRRFMAERVEDGDDDDVAGDENVVGTARHSGYNVLGSELTCCCSDVGGSGIGTGFYRNGLCGECFGE